MKMYIEHFREKVAACWMGKNIGGTLGGPYEGFPDVNSLTFYDPVPQGSMPNDDLELQAMYAAALSLMEKPIVNRFVLAEIWKKHMNFHCDEYAVAIKNLSIGLLPPWSGAYDNYFACGMGAAIRSELWACMTPGDPELAAGFAREDACIDHAGDGINAEVFFAVIEALAFVESDIRKLINAGLSYLPEDSVLAAGIRAACALWDSSHDWLAVRNELFARYATECRTSVLINVPFTVLALLSGNGDFGKTICDAANCGMDTDCTAATAGAILGILNPDGIPAEWKRPVGHELVVRENVISGLKFPPTIEAFTDQVLSLQKRIPAKMEPVGGEEPDFSAYRIPVDVSMRHNSHWYQVEPRKGEWKRFLCDSIFAELEVPPEFRGNGGQILLRFRFNLPADGDYTIMFNCPSSNQVYLDRTEDILHDDVHMLFGRQRLWVETIVRGKQFACSERQTVFSPTLGGAPLNQYKRHLRLSKGNHTLLAAVEPLSDEEKIIWGMGIGCDCRFLTNVFVSDDGKSDL